MIKYWIKLSSFKNKTGTCFVQKLVLQIISILVKKGCKNVRLVGLPIKKKKICMQLPAHIHEDAKKHFEKRITKKIIDFEVNKEYDLSIFWEFYIPAHVYIDVIKLNGRRCS